MPAPARPSRHRARSLAAPPSGRAARAVALDGRLLVAVAVAVVALMAAGCSHTDGRQLARPDPGLTATTPPTTVPPTSLGPFLSLKSPVVEVNGSLPTRFTCHGADVSPPLSIDGVPTGTESLALSLTDPDAQGFVHWAVIGIDPTVGTVGADQVPAGAVEYPNDFGDAAYGGPCPPDGQRHTYVFTVYALPATAVDFLGPDETNGAAVIDTVSRLSSTSAALTVSYESPG